jgi:hypothetical protein
MERYGGTAVSTAKTIQTASEELISRSRMIGSIVLVSLLCALIGLVIMIADTTGHPWIDLFGQVCWAMAIVAAAVGLFGI